MAGGRCLGDNGVSPVGRRAAACGFGFGTRGARLRLVNDQVVRYCIKLRGWTGEPLKVK